MKRKIAAFTGMLLILASAGNIYANVNTTDAGTCSFDGKDMVSTFDSNKLAVSVSEMEPGDSVNFKVAISNDSNISTNWYMSNDVISSLEDAQSVAENGGYTYILTYIDSENKEKTIYSSTSVGGEKDTSAGKGLNEATSSLDNFFSLDTLEPGEKGTVDLIVGLDGESQGNIYQDTLAKLMMNFAVEDNSQPSTPNPPTYNTPPKVKTGDIWSVTSIIAFVLGVIMILLACFWRKGARKSEKKN